MPDHIVAELPKSARERIRVVLREKGGNLGCEVRVATKNGQGILCETAKGLRIPLDRLDDVIEALQDARRLAGRSRE